MLAIRLQRTGRSGHAQFRVIVQDSRFSPSGGRVVAYLGSYDPHTKTSTIDSQKAAKYLENGAQPSDRVAGLLQKEGVKLPAWVKTGSPKEGAVRNPDKRRSSRPPEPEAPAAEPGAPAEDTSPAVDDKPAEAPSADTSAEPDAEEPAAEQTPAKEEPAAQEPDTPEAAAEPPEAPDAKEKPAE